MKSPYLIAALLLIGQFAAAETAGTLLIVGGGEMPDDVRAAYFEAAGGKQRARMVVIPTASEYADDPQENEYFFEDWRPLGPLSLQRLHTRDRRVADDPAFAAPLTQATGVWLSGGDQVKLATAYRDTLVLREIRGVLARGGIVGGTSAGAAIMSDPMIEEGDTKAKVGPGFGLLPGVVVDQHFIARGRITRLRGMLADHPQLAGMGIDESTAIIVRGDDVTVVGASTVTVIWPQESATPGTEQVLKAGDKLNLAELRGKSPAE